MIGKIKFICYEIDIHKHSVDIKIAKKCTWITVAEMRVLRTISRYWIAKINIRIAEVSTTLSYIDRWVVFFLSFSLLPSICFSLSLSFFLQFSSGFVLFALCTSFIQREAQSGSTVEWLCRMSTQQEQRKKPSISYTFKFIWNSIVLLNLPIHTSAFELHRQERFDDMRISTKGTHQILITFFGHNKLRCLLT